MIVDSTTKNAEYVLCFGENGELLGRILSLDTDTGEAQQAEIMGGEVKTRTIKVAEVGIRTASDQVQHYPVSQLPSIL